MVPKVAKKTRTLRTSCDSIVCNFLWFFSLKNSEADQAQVLLLPSEASHDDAEVCTEQTWQNSRPSNMQRCASDGCKGAAHLQFADHLDDNLSDVFVEACFNQPWLVLKLVIANNEKHSLLPNVLIVPPAQTVLQDAGSKSSLQLLGLAFRTCLEYQVYTVIGLYISFQSRRRINQRKPRLVNEVIFQCRVRKLQRKWPHWP